MTSKINYWQWPNVLAIDAALICAAWQFALARALGLTLEWPAYAVLGLSVWLTYTADRLFDISSRDIVELLSVRHQFSKKFASLLWRVWFLVLFLNLAFATQLTQIQLKHGGILLAACLFYTLLNQKLSRRFFPKELCVALIYTGGTIVFIPAKVPLSFALIFALLSLLNCLIIGAKEKSIDQEMKIHSMTPLLAEPWLSIIAAIGIALTFLVEVDLCSSMAACFGLLGLLHIFCRNMPIETYRVIADTILLLGPLIALISL